MATELKKKIIKKAAKGAIAEGVSEFAATKGGGKMMKKATKRSPVTKTTGGGIKSAGIGVSGTKAGRDTVKSRKTKREREKNNLLVKRSSGMYTY